MPLNIAILASGSGTNAQAMFDKAAAGVLDVNIRARRLQPARRKSH